MLAVATRRKTGGRAAGTPNKTTVEVKAFFEGVLRQAFKSRAFRKRLVAQIVALEIDTKLLMHILDRAAGKTTTPVDVAHAGRVTLEQIVAGTVPPDGEGGDP